VRTINSAGTSVQTADPGRDSMHGGAAAAVNPAEIGRIYYRFDS
jgi:hypothetical protein